MPQRWTLKKHEYSDLWAILFGVNLIMVILSAGVAAAYRVFRLVSGL